MVEREGNESSCYGSWRWFTRCERTAGRFALDGRGAMESAEVRVTRMVLENRGLGVCGGGGEGGGDGGEVVELCVGTFWSGDSGVVERCEGGEAGYGLEVGGGG